MENQEVVKRSRGRPIGSKTTITDKTKGIQPGPTYISFGNCLINTKKLTDDIISLRNSNGCQSGHPITRVSSNLSGIIKKIVGGEIPTFDSLSKLTNDEKIYLNKISKKANIHDKISIPTPSKDEQDKDIHQFEVLKGEIMSGNDSDVLVKKFKLIILKLLKQGLLPKGQVNEILLDLTEIGY